MTLPLTTALERICDGKPHMRAKSIIPKVRQWERLQQLAHERFAEESAALLRKFEADLYLAEIEDRLTEQMEQERMAA